MNALFSFNGRLARLPYVVLATALFFSQHALTWLLFPIAGNRLKTDIAFWLVPLRSLTQTTTSVAPVILFVAFAYLLLVAGLLALLSFRRAHDANTNGWLAAAAVAPALQIPVIVVLAALPSRPASDTLPAPFARGGLGWVPAAQGMVAGLALTLAAVAVSTLVFGVYGYGLFIFAPFVIGGVTAFFANREADVGTRRTDRIAMGALLLSGIGLVLVALEGLTCILMASPLAAGAAFLGGRLGRAIANSRHNRPQNLVPVIAALPLVFALEAIMPATTTFVTEQRIAVRAAPETVWQSLLVMDIAEPPSLLFRVGVAYPLRGEIVGEGVGAQRNGTFSTGTAIERVTEWSPARKLAFTVEKDVPAMREVSPYEHVHAPHAVGYFRTDLTSFELVPQGIGQTEIVERTSHELRLDPVLYWLPMARWIVAENNARVLRHLKLDAESRAEIALSRPD